MSKKAKLKDARKMTTKAILERLDNPIISSFGEELLASNPTAFKSLMWDMFGTKQGQKIIDKLGNVYGSVTPPSRVNNDDLTFEDFGDTAPAKEPITWEEFNERLAYNGSIKANIDYRSPRNDKLRSTLDMGIENETIDHIGARIEFESPYFTNAAAICINSDILHHMDSLEEFTEVLYNKTYDVIDMFIEDLEEYISSAKNIPPHIYDEYDQLIDVIRSGGAIDTIRALAFDIYSIVALLFATETGAAVNNNLDYKPKYRPHELRWVGASSVRLGVRKVIITYVDESDKVKENVYNTSFIDRPIAKGSMMDDELLTNLTDSLGSLVANKPCTMEEVLADFIPSTEETTEECDIESEVKEVISETEATEASVDDTTADEEAVTEDT